MCQGSFQPYSTFTSIYQRHHNPFHLTAEHEPTEHYVTVGVSYPHEAALGHAGICQVHGRIKADTKGVEDGTPSAHRSPKAKRKAAYPSFRFPRFCRFAWRALEGFRFPHLAGQFCIGKALAHYLRYSQHKPIRVIERIIPRCAVVVPENLLNRRAGMLVNKTKKQSTMGAS